MKPLKPMKTHWFVLLAFVVAVLLFYLAIMDVTSSMTLIYINFENAQYGDRVIFEKIPSSSGKIWNESLRYWLRPEGTTEASSILGRDLFTQLVNVPVPSVWNIYRMENEKKIFVMKYSVENDDAGYSHVITVGKNGDISVVIVKKQYKVPR